MVRSSSSRKEIGPFPHPTGRYFALGVTLRNTTPQHVVEVLNTVDAGTSLLLEAQVAADVTAETALACSADTLRRHGLPEVVALDRDPRFVGHAPTQDIPAPLLRFLRCLGVAVQVNPPQRPDLNAFVERYHKTYESLVFAK